MEDQAYAEFASPFKRRKAVLMDKGAECDAAASEGFRSPPPAARKLGRFFTPQGKSKGPHAAAAPAGSGTPGPSAPATPGADARAATDARARDVFGAGSPAAKGAGARDSDALPPQLALLRDLLGALYATLPLVKARGQLTTLPNLRGPVQNLSGRSLKVDHLQQIKAIYPDAFGWQHVLVAAGRSGRMEEHLMVTLIPFEKLQQGRERAEAAEAEAAEAAGTPKKRGGARGAAAAAAAAPGSGRGGAVGCSAAVQGTMAQQKEFVAALRAKAASGKVEPADELPLAPLPGPAHPSTRDSTPVRRQGSSGSFSSGGGSFSAVGSLDAPPRTPQTGASGRAAASPAATPPRVATPDTDATVRSLAFSPAAARLPVPRFDAAAPAGAATPGTPSGTKRDAAGAALRRAPACGAGAATAPPAAAGGTAGLLSPRGGERARGTEVGKGMRPSRLCFDAVADPAAAKAPQQPARQQGGHPKDDSEDAAAAAAPPRPRRLAFDAPGAAGGAAGGAAQLPREGGGPARTLSGGLQFSLKASTMALLDRAASAQARIETARRTAELSARHHLDLAAATFEVLRCVFGDRGPCAMPRQQVVTQIRARSTCKSGLSPDDADEQLRLMLRLLPAWIHLDHPAGVALADMKVVVRIHRRTPWPELRRQLLERVAESRAAGAAAAAGADAEAAAAAGAADAARDAAEAAAAAAAEAAAVQADGGPEAEAAAASDAAGSDFEDEPLEMQRPALRRGGAPPQPAPAASGERAGAPEAGGGAAGEEGRGEAQAELVAALKARVWGRRG